MRTKALVLAAVLALPSALYAAGPLYLYDASRQIPYAYPGPVRVYTDLGTLGGMNNEQARSAVAFAVEQWNAVPTSSFHADVVGNLGLLGLSDITAANVADVIGKDNGGGIHIIFDSDGSILRDVLGVGYGVLGVATPELVEDGSPAIHESWVIINGEGIPDPASYPGIDVVAEFTGVITHEFGHATNLAHSQTNGAVVFYGDKPVPQSCDDSAVGYPDVHHVETMYPFISPGWTGAVQSTVDMLDDRVSLSNIYPSPGWPASYGSVAGAILMPDGSTPTMGVNVVARNMADPFADAVSALSGDSTQGELGTDGRYRLNGLTPGARYVLYGPSPSTRSSTMDDDSTRSAAATAGGAASCGASDKSHPVEPGFAVGFSTPHGMDGRVIAGGNPPRAR